MNKFEYNNNEIVINKFENHRNQLFIYFVMDIEDNIYYYYNYYYISNGYLCCDL